MQIRRYINYSSLFRFINLLKEQVSQIEMTKVISSIGILDPHVVQLSLCLDEPCVVDEDVNVVHLFLHRFREVLNRLPFAEVEGEVFDLSG